MNHRPTLRRCIPGLVFSMIISACLAVLYKGSFIYCEGTRWDVYSMVLTIFFVLYTWIKPAVHRSPHPSSTPLGRYRTMATLVCIVSFAVNCAGLPQLLRVRISLPDFDAYRVRASLPHQHKYITVGFVRVYGVEHTSGQVFFRLSPPGDQSRPMLIFADKPPLWADVYQPVYVSTSWYLSKDMGIELYNP